MNESKSLKSVMNITKVFYVLAIIAAVCSFLSAAGCLLGALIVGVLKNNPDFTEILKELLTKLSADYDIPQVATVDGLIKCAIATLLHAFIIGGGSGACFVLSALLLNTVKKQGTPFSKPVVKTARTYGIAFIAISVATSIVAAIVSSAVAHPYDLTISGNYEFLIAGVALILTSFFIDYGADLREAANSVSPAPESAKQTETQTNCTLDNVNDDNLPSGGDLFD